jgi:hypothetical protein
LLSTPKKKPGATAFSYATGLFRKLVGNSPPQNPSSFEIGTITYSNGSSASLIVPANGGASYTIEIRGQHPVQGLSINSHRPVQNYQPIASIPTNAIDAEQAYQTYYSEVMQRFNNGYTQFQFAVPNPQHVLEKPAHRRAGHARARRRPLAMPFTLSMSSSLRRAD